MAIITILDMIVLGFLLGFCLITKFALSKSEAAAKKGEEIRGKIVGFQVPLGVVAIIGGLYLLLAFLLDIAI